MKILIINNLSFVTLPLMFFFRLINYKIYFVSIKSYLRNKKLLNYLNNLNIHWFNYQDYDLHDVTIEKLVAVPKFSKSLGTSISKNFWELPLKEVFDNSNYFVASLSRYITRESDKLFEVMSIAKSFENNNKVFLWIPNSLISRKMNSEIFRIKNLNIFPNFYLFLFFTIVFRVFKKKIKIFFSKKIKKNESLNTNNDLTNADNLNSYKIACYPHKGIYYGDLYLKDFFYSYDESNFLYYKKILHLEWDKTSLPKISKEYYAKNSIKYLYLKNLSNSWLLLKKNILYWAKNLNLLLKIAKYDIQILYFVLLSTYLIIESQENLHKLKNLKIILACNDELFPIELSIACKKENIITISTQDRLFTSNILPLFIFDFYFVAGEMSKQITKKRMSESYIKSIKNLYLVKTDKYKNFKNNLSNGSYNCIVMDYPSSPYWYKNGRHDMLSWKANKNFYNIIINLSKKYPEVNFLIKSKNYKWTTIPFYGNIIEEINQRKNISILINQTKLTTNECLNTADFVLAVTSSLAEEMLSIGKPVIIYNSYGGHPKKLFNYGEKILANNYEEISEKINLIIKNYQKFNSELDLDRSKLFYENNPGQLNAEINKIYSEKVLQN